MDEDIRERVTPDVFAFMRSVSIVFGCRPELLTPMIDLAFELAVKVHKDAVRELEDINDRPTVPNGCFAGEPTPVVNYRDLAKPVGSR